jgi:hypothetical protein
MHNIFILYIPPNNSEALVHYEDTIKNKVEPTRIYNYVERNLQNKLSNIYNGRRITVWGSRNTDANRSKFEKMQAGDDILIVEGDTIKLLGKIAAKTINQDLSRELWKNLKGESLEGWDLIYFIANPQEIELPFKHFVELFGYKANWNLRGFTSIAEDKLYDFYNRYDDLYSILIKLKKGEQIDVKNNTGDVREDINRYLAEDKPERNVIGTDEISDHLRMQWKLIHLGKKCGSKIWIPKNDQSRVDKEYHFNDFEVEFTAGLDTPAKYVENIDVVWKEEFRIDAAFEIENTTSIYSGLLRFSDLKIVAPNSLYPLFIVAPSEKKNRVIEQVKRPTFRKLDFNRKVRYLSYEAVDEIDSFFEKSTSGLSVDLLTGKSESLNE